MGNEQSEEKEGDYIIKPDTNSNEPIFNFGKEDKDQSQKNVPFSRRKEQRKTIATSSKSPHLQSLQSMMKEEKKGGKSLFAKQSNESKETPTKIIDFNKENESEIDKEKEINEPSKLQRRGNRSIY